MIDDKNIISSHIVKTRQSLGLNQSEFARQLGISRACLHLYESGKRLISTEVVLRICKLYNKEPNDILGLND